MRALAVLGIALALAAPAVAEAPVVRVAGTHPFTVQGTGFRPLERVRVVVRVKGGVTTSVAADRRGAFRLRLPLVEIAACAGYVVVATGDGGSRAVLKVPQRCDAEPVL